MSPLLSTELLHMIFSVQDTPTLKAIRLTNSHLSAVATPLLFSTVRLHTSQSSVDKLLHISQHPGLRQHPRRLIYVASLLLGSTRFHSDPDAEMFGLTAFEHWRREGVGVGLGMSRSARAAFAEQFSHDELLWHYTRMRAESRSQAVVVALAGNWGSIGQPAAQGTLDAPTGKLEAALANLPRLASLELDTQFGALGHGWAPRRAAEEPLPRSSLAAYPPLARDTLQAPLDWGGASGYLQVFAHLLQALDAGRPKLPQTDCCARCEEERGEGPIKSLVLAGLQDSAIGILHERSAPLRRIAASLRELTLDLPLSPSFVQGVVPGLLGEMRSLRRLSICGDRGAAEPAARIWPPRWCGSSAFLQSVLGGTRLPALEALMLRGLVVEGRVVEGLAAAAPGLRALDLADLQLRWILPGRPDGWAEGLEDVLPGVLPCWPGLLAGLGTKLGKLERLRLRGWFYTNHFEVGVGVDDAEWLGRAGIKGSQEEWTGRLQGEIVGGVADLPGGILEGGKWPWERDVVMGTAAVV